MVIADICSACMRGDHDKCEYPGPARDMTSCVCICEVCSTRKAAAQERFNARVINTLYGSSSMEEVLERIRNVKIILLKNLNQLDEVILIEAMYSQGLNPNSERLREKILKEIAEELGLELPIVQ